MRPLTEAELRDCFVNTSRRETAQASVPPLDLVDWDSREVLGWRDEKRPGISYVVLEDAEGLPRGIMLRPGAATGPRKKALCSWCEDVTATDDVVMYIARRAGAAGRRGDTVGTLICSDFACSRNVRRAPSLAEIGAKASAEEVEYFRTLRIEGLRDRSRAFLAHVLAD